MEIALRIGIFDDSNLLISTETSCRCLLLHQDNEQSNPDDSLVDAIIHTLGSCC